MWPMLGLGKGWGPNAKVGRGGEACEAALNVDASTEYPEVSMVVDDRAILDSK